MTGFIRSRTGRGGATLLLLAAGWLVWPFFFPAEAERRFIPGELGRERGWFQPANSANGYVTRAMYGLSGPGAVEWAHANGLTDPPAFSHNLGRVFPPELFDRHPEYFPLIAGVRLRPPEGSYFWNPDLGRDDVAVHAAEAARAEFTRAPETESFALGVNDGLTFGESPETRALVTPVRWFRGRPDYSPLIFTFMNRTAEKLARSQPQKYLGALAYYWAENAPGFPVNPQVIPFLTADRAQGYDSDFQRAEFALQKRWAAAGSKRLGLYDYLYGGGFLIPRIHSKLLATNLRHARRAGFTDYFAEVNPNWGLDGPMPWLAAQLAQDPGQSEAALLDEFYRRYFREAAAPMRIFFTTCERQWMLQPGPAYWLKHYRSESQAALFPSKICTELRQMLRQAERLARSDKVRERVQLVSLAFGVTERFVEMQEAREALNRLSLGGMAGWRELADVLGRFVLARKNFIRHAAAVRHEQPLALAPFEWQDYLKHDPVPAAVLALREAFGRSGGQGMAEAEVHMLHEPVAGEIWRCADSIARHEGRELIRNASFAGVTNPARQVADLIFGVSLPAEWASKVEPAEHHQAGLLGTAPKILRVTGTRDTAVFQWNPSRASGKYAAEVWIRGHVSAGSNVSLTLGWLDKKERHLGLQTHRLPEGDWVDWVPLRLVSSALGDAAWVGVGLRVQDQVADDWLEARTFSLLELP